MEKNYDNRNQEKTLLSNRGFHGFLWGGGYGHEVRQGVAAKARELVHEGADDDHGHSLPKQKSVSAKRFFRFLLYRKRPQPHQAAGTLIIQTGRSPINR